MRMTLRTYRGTLLAAGLAGLLFSLPEISLAATAPAGTVVSDDSATVSEVQSKLDKSQFTNIKVTVQDGVATLSGTVDLYEYKTDADKRVHKVKGVTAVRNEIEVAGPTVSDQELQAKLQEKLAYDRVGYGNTFNAITGDCAKWSRNSWGPRKDGCGQRFRLSIGEHLSRR